MKLRIRRLNSCFGFEGGCSTQCAQGESAVNNVYRYDPRFNTWFQVASMTDRRSYFFACALDKQVYAIGGKNRDGAISTAEVYDANKNEWKCIRSMPAVYHAHAGTMYQNKIYITGGYSQGHFTSDLQVYSRDDDHWDDLTPMHMARGWHTMAEALGRLYVFGGCHLNANQQAQAVVQTEFYMPAYDQWTIVSSLISLHKEASCVKYYDFIFVLGGYNLESKCGQRLVSRYDYKNDSWDSFGQLTSGQTGVGYCILDLPWYSSCANDTNESN
jgi:kelch-like protein 9/13